MKKIAKNLIWGFGGQFLGLAVSIILPRYILISFGSEVNGITSTITQIFTYIALLEAGIGNASLNCLYKNIAQADEIGISTTISATRKYFRKIIPAYFGCVVFLTVCLPLIIRTEVPTRTIRFIILIQGLCGVVNFHFTNTYTQLLIADGRNYVTSNLNLLVKVVSTVVQILLINKGFDIVSVQLSLLFAYIIKAVIIHLYIKKEYPWLVALDSSVDIRILDQRKSFVIHEISTVVFNSTDVFLISVFCSLKEASIYSVYNMIFAALSSITSIFFKGIDYYLGVEFHRDKKKYLRLHDLYETLYSCFVFAIISAAYVVILPFVKLYTAGVTDAKYLQPVLPILFGVIQILSCSRAVASKLIAISGKTKETVPNSIFEMLINLILSVVLVNYLGMYGVLLGTIIALLYRTNDIILYANLKILQRRPYYAYKTMVINLALFSAIVVFVKKSPLIIESYMHFLAWGAISLMISFALYYGVHFAFNVTFREAFVGTVLGRCKKNLPS